MAEEMSSHGAVLSGWFSIYSGEEGEKLRHIAQEVPGSTPGWKTILLREMSFSWADSLHDSGLSFLEIK